MILREDIESVCVVRWGWWIGRSVGKGDISERWWMGGQCCFFIEVIDDATT